MSDAIPESHFLNVLSECIANGADPMESPYFVADVTVGRTLANTIVVMLRHDDGTVQRFQVAVSEILPRFNVAVLNGA